MTAGAVFLTAVATIAYAYVGYPAALALLTARRSRPRWPTTPPRSVTVLIAAYREEAAIRAKLENTLAIDYPPDRLQIVVAVDGDDDSTADVVRAFAPRGVELSHQTERRGKSAAISRALALATGEIVVLSDANNLYDRDALRALVAPFADPEVGAVTGAKTVGSRGTGHGSSEGAYWRYESYVKERETRLGSCTGVAGEILAVRRDVLEPVPADVINDDFWIALAVLRRGLRIVYEPGARSFEPVSRTAADEAARRARIVAGRYQVMARAGEVLPWRHPVVVWQIVSHKFLRPLVPLAAIVAALASAIGLVRGRRWSRGAVVGELGFLGAAWLGRRAAMRGSRWRRLGYVPAFLVDSNRAALAGAWRWLTGTQGVRWERARR